MFNQKRLLIVAGPTGCGKSTFLSSALGSKPSPLTKEILKNTFTRSDYKIEKLFLKRLKKLYEKQGRFQKFTRRHNNFILDVDTTGARFKDNAIIFPQLFSEFDHILSIQIFTPYEIWINRILERKINLIGKYAREASYELGLLSNRNKNQCLVAASKNIKTKQAIILKANKKDMVNAKKKN